MIINNKTISYILLFQRRQRVLGLLGFYHFEKGELDKAASYFEQSTIDIREVSYFPLLLLLYLKWFLFWYIDN